MKNGSSARCSGRAREHEPAGVGPRRRERAGGAVRIPAELARRSRGSARGCPSETPGRPFSAYETAPFDTPARFGDVADRRAGRSRSRHRLPFRQVASVVDTTLPVQYDHRSRSSFPATAALRVESARTRRIQLPSAPAAIVRAISSVESTPAGVCRRIEHREMRSAVLGHYRAARSSGVSLVTVTSGVTALSPAVRTSMSPLARRDDVEVGDEYPRALQFRRLRDRSRRRRCRARCGPPSTRRPSGVGSRANS